MSTSSNTLSVRTSMLPESQSDSLELVQRLYDRGDMIELIKNCPSADLLISAILEGPAPNNFREPEQLDEWRKFQSFARKLQEIRSDI